jgi:hypothetical protein
MEKWSVFVCLCSLFSGQDRQLDMMQNCQSILFKTCSLLSYLLSITNVYAIVAGEEEEERRRVEEEEFWNRKYNLSRPVERSEEVPEEEGGERLNRVGGRRDRLIEKKFFPVEVSLNLNFSVNLVPCFYDFGFSCLSLIERVHKFNNCFFLFWILL